LNVPDDRASQDSGGRLQNAQKTTDIALKHETRRDKKLHSHDKNDCMRCTYCVFKL